MRDVGVEPSRGASSRRGAPATAPWISRETRRWRTTWPGTTGTSRMCVAAASACRGRSRRRPAPGCARTRRSAATASPPMCDPMPRLPKHLRCMYTK